MTGPDADGDGGEPALVPLPVQPEEVSLPDDDWPHGEAPDPARLASVVDEAFGEDGPLATTYAVLVVHRGRLVAERYGGGVPRGDGSVEPVGAGTRLGSWSMAKSMLHAVVGILVAEGSLGLDEPAPVPQWQALGDPRRAITLEHLLDMRDGLDFAEDYEDAGRSDVIEMLFGAGRSDVAAFAADRPLAAAPGRRFSYSSGTSNIVSGIVAAAVGPGAAYRRFLDERLFAPIGMRSAEPGFDDAGTWVASSFVDATARDFARFGLLVLRDGRWGRHRILPEGWVDHGRRERSDDPESGWGYGAHWWLTRDRHGSFWASGYEGQSITVSPGLDALVVRLGRTPEVGYPALAAWRARVLDALT